MTAPTLTADQLNALRDRIAEVVAPGQADKVAGFTARVYDSGVRAGYAATTGAHPDPDLDALRMLAEHATPGEWHTDGPWWHDDGPDGPEEAPLVTAGDDRRPVVLAPPRTEPGVTADQQTADTAYVAAASPAVVLALLDRLDAAERRLTADVPDPQVTTEWAIRDPEDGSLSFAMLNGAGPHAEHYTRLTAAGRPVVARTITTYPRRVGEWEDRP